MSSCTFDIFTFLEKGTKDYFVDRDGKRIQSFRSKDEVRKFLNKRKDINDSTVDFCVLHDSNSGGYLMYLHKDFFYSDTTVPQFYKNIYNRNRRAKNKIAST